MTDKAEYRIAACRHEKWAGRRVQERVVHWSESPNLIQIMANLIGKQHEDQVSAELGRQNTQPATLPWA